jgi:hypothetical protein
MKSRFAWIIVAVLLLASPALFAQEKDFDKEDQGPEDAVIHYAKGHAKSSHSRNGSPLMTNHGGDIMTFVQPVEAIFWGTGWNNAGFAGDKISGVDTFYSGMGSSTYAHTCSEYSGPAGVFVGDSITYNGHIIDSTRATGGSSTGAILAEVCRQIPNPQPNGYYPVYVDIPRGRASFCAWHSAGSCNGVTVQFAFFFNLDGDPGCDPQSTAGYSQGLAALANVSGHEISETRTDPQLNAWYDSSGNENGDKCAWSFGTNLLTFSNGSQWKIQGNWSNAAYTSSNRGYDNLSGQKGCIDGGNYK